MVAEFLAKDITLPDVQKDLLSRSIHGAICILFEGNEKEFPGFLFTLKNRFEKVYFTLRLTRQIEFKTFVKEFPHWILSELYVLPVPFDLKNPQTLTCQETRNLVFDLREKGAPAKPLPYRDFEGVPEKYEDGTVIKWQSQVSEKPFLSVIIPTRNYENFLINGLRHLFDQDLARTNYEVIVVDDGGTDKSFEKSQLLLGPLSSQINFKYIYCARKPGTENQFHAGHCRNKGIAVSRGEWILFLDSDMLVSSSFLSSLIAQTSKADVIQCPRMHIKPEKSSQDTSLAEVAEKDLYLEEPTYWKSFFETEDWASIPFGWRYTCTYCLAVRRSALEQVGFFRHVFRSYGFEDTDLGYRLFQAGFRFLMWKENVFHLSPSREKSRYYHSIWRKQVLLSVTGKTFFLSTLDLEIFQMFKIYMMGEPRWKQKIYAYYHK